MNKVKHPSDSLVIMNELVLPNDTNLLNNLMGGRLLHWMDICAAMTARKHCSRSVVTASVDGVSFNSPIRLGDVVSLTSKITRTFRTSMEIHIEVWAENMQEGTRLKSNEAYYTFVAVDGYGTPIQVAEIEPENEEEQRKYDGALRRRQLRLILAGRMKPEDANELRALFVRD